MKMVYETQVGAERPKAELVKGRYTGSEIHLLGHTALISEAPRGFALRGDLVVWREDGWLVQVDDHSSLYAFGWWWFALAEWEPQRYFRIRVLCVNGQKKDYEVYAPSEQGARVLAFQLNGDDPRRVSHLETIMIYTEPVENH